MKFVFTDKKVNLPNKVHAYAEKKVGKLDRYFKADAEAAIVFSVKKTGTAKRMRVCRMFPSVSRFVRFM